MIGGGAAPKARAKPRPLATLTVPSDPPEGRSGHRSYGGSVKSQEEPLSGPPLPVVALADLPASVERLVGYGVKLVVWDFDLTVLNIHSFGLRITEAAVAGRDLDADFVDKVYFVTLVRLLVGAGVHVAIASFGKYEIIQGFLDRAFGVGVGGVGGGRIFSRDNILTPSSVGGTDGFSLRLGKNAMLQQLAKTHNVLPAQVLFFDGEPR